MRLPFRCCAVASIAISLCATLGCFKDSAPVPPGSRGELRDIRLFDLDDKPTGIWNPARPTITVAVFTRTDCPISNRYAPTIRHLYETYHRQGVEFYLIYVDPRQDPRAIREHLQQYGYPCPGLRDPEHVLASHCNATITPEAVVFDQSGDMVYRGRIDNRHEKVGGSQGEPTVHDLANAIASAVAGRPTPNPRTQAIGCLIADLKD